MNRGKAKVILLSTGLAYGGAETHPVRLAAQLKVRGWDVRIISIMPPVAFVEELGASGIPLASLGIQKKVTSPRALPRTVRLLRSWKPQILTSFMYHGNVLGRTAGRLARVPIVISSIRNERFGGGFRDRIIRWTNWRDDCVTTNSRLVADALIQRGVVSQERVSVIPNAIRVERYKLPVHVRNRVRAELNIPDRAFLWLAVGRLEPQKDYFTLLEAFRKATSSDADIHLLVAGQGFLKEELERKVDSLELKNCVTFLGLRTDIPALLAAADAFILSSAWEGFPNVVMEAMAARKPVVATSVGGVPELVQLRVSGLLIPPKAPDALAEAMLELMLLPENELHTMGEAGRRHVEEHYSLEHVVDLCEDLYTELLEKKGLL